MKRCIAFTEKQILINGGKSCSIVYVPCSLRAKDMGKRFCSQHARAYRELLLGIVTRGGRRADK